MSRRRRALSRVYSLSCTDAQWEAFRRLAARRGLSISRYLVECGLHGDPHAGAPEPAPRLALEETEQRALLNAVGRIAERTVAAESEEAVLSRIRNALALLVELAMRAMVREGREDELRAVLTELFGERAAAAAMERMRARGDPQRPQR